MAEHFLFLVSVAFVLRFIFADGFNEAKFKMDKAIDNLKATRYTVNTDAGQMTFKCHLSICETRLAEIVKHLNKRIAISTDEQAYKEYVREYINPQHIRDDGTTFVEFSIDDKLWGPVQLDQIDTYMRFRMPDGQVCKRVKFKAQDDGQLRPISVS